MRITQLYSGGVMVNYYCSSRCAHCMYASSPTWPKEYMDAAMAERVFVTLARFGCHCVHIGGGEPLLNPEGLYQVLEAANRHNVAIEYIETNASWYQPAQPQRTQAVLAHLLALGVDMLLISISPFHNAYIPYEKITGLTDACKAVNMAVFPYQRQFIPDICAMDTHTPHPLAEYEQRYGTHYVRDAFRRFGIGPGGRAIATAARWSHTPPEALCNSPPCHGLCETHHFHIDLFGRFVPGGCPGMGFDIGDLGAVLAPDKYPIAYALYTQGVRGLWDIACEAGFIPDAQGYANHCHLCMAMRTFLCKHTPDMWPELTPQEYYAEAWRMA